jgi:hypothetical protein
MDLQKYELWKEVMLLSRLSNKGKRRESAAVLKKMTSTIPSYLFQ